MARLRIQSKKVKEVLSANMQTPVIVEALTNDIDYKSQVCFFTFLVLALALLPLVLRPRPPPRLFAVIFPASASSCSFFLSFSSSSHRV